MDNENTSNNLNQDNSLPLTDVIEEITVDNLENYLLEEFDDEAYVDEVYIENNLLTNEQENHLSQEIESQDQEHNSSHEMESSTNDQCLTQPDNSVLISLLDSDDEDTSNAKLEPTLSVVSDECLSKINYIETPQNRNMFPGYNEKVFIELKNFISNKTLNDFVDISRKSGIIKIVDLLRLLIPNQWLNDLIMQQYFNLLIKNSNKDNILNLCTFFFSDIAKNGFNGYVETFLKKKNLLNYNVVMVPTHLDNSHWALIVAEINEKKISIFDSFITSCESLNKKMMIFISFLNNEFINKRLNSSKPFNLAWDIYLGGSPVQENLSDCGVFVCTNARYFIFDEPITFNQGDIPLIRQRMSYELIHNTLLPTL